jgi:hypothetical protein
MADLVITAANVAAGVGARTVTGTAGATITAGQVVYQDPADSRYKLADANSGTAAIRVPAGIALHGSLAGQPLTILVQGLITIGAAVSQGVAYYLSATPGGIAVAADMVTGVYPTIMGIAVSATVIDVQIHQSGVAVP